MDFLSMAQKHIFTTSSKDIEQICLPLEKVGISFFVYCRIYPDRKRLFLCNKPRWSENFLLKYCQNLYQESSEIEENIKHNLFIVPEMYPNINTFQDAKGLLGLRSGIIVPIYYAKYKEVCYFASEKLNSYQNNYYMDNIDMLLRFINYFKHKANRIIILAEKSTVDPPNSMPILDTQNEKLNFDQKINKEQFMSEIKPKQLYLPFDKNQTPITNREYQCLKLIVEGKSSKEIGRYLKISPKTVENFIEKIKIKFNCRKISQLIYNLAKLGF